jgi:hypothetical protein
MKQGTEFADDKGSVGAHWANAVPDRRQIDAANKEHRTNQPRRAFDPFILASSCKMRKKNPTFYRSCVS